jgi:hypothetical protein
MHSGPGQGYHLKETPGKGNTQHILDSHNEFGHFMPGRRPYGRDIITSGNRSPETAAEVSEARRRKFYSEKGE